MIEAIGIWFIAILTFLLGYFLGKGKEGVEEVRQIKKAVKKAIDREPVGAVMRPSAQEVYRMETEEGRKIAEEEGEMRKVFSKPIPEI